MSKKNRAPKLEKQVSEKPVAGVATVDRKFARRAKAAAPGISARVLILAGILAITFAAFANTLRNGFAYDDTTQILQNELIRDWSNLPAALTKEVWFWRVQQDKDPTKQDGPTTPYYRPVFVVYLMVGWHLFGGASATGWHFANILMHLLAVLFVFLICEKISGDLRITAIATLLFAIHPLRSESVAWISGSTDLFLALFLLPSFYFYLRYRESFARRHLAISLLFFFLAAFSKEPAVALPIFIGAYELFILNREQPFLRRLLPAVEFGGLFFAVAVIYFMMRYHALGFVLSDSNYKAYSTLQVLLTIPLAITKYIGLLFFPVNLSVFHYTEMVQSPLSYRFLLPLAFVAALSFGLWQLRRSRVALFAILWFAINLLPVLNLNALAEDFLVQERYVYIPSLGFSLLIAMALVKIPIEKWLSVGSRQTAQIAIVLLLTIVFAGKTLAQNTTWKDDETLWVHGQQTAPDQMMSNYILGHYYIKQNKPQKVVELLEQYMTINDTNVIVVSNLAAARLQMYELTFDRTHIDRAIVLCEHGLRLQEDNAPLWDTLGHAYSYDTEIKNYSRARAFFTRALQIEPSLAVANFHMGATFIKEGRLDEGIRFLEAARLQQIDFPDTHKFLGVAYNAKGETQKAIDSFTLYLRFQPNALDAAKVRQDIENLRAKLTTGNQPAAPDGSVPIGVIQAPK